MALCINKNSVDFQTLKHRSGLSEFLLDAICSDFQERLGRWPELDELPNSNSEPYLRESLNIKEDSSSVKDILNETNTSSIEEATIQINNTHRDLEVDLLQLGDRALVNVKHRPTIYKQDTTEKQTVDKNVNTAVFINNTVEKLAKLYGIQIHSITNAELISDKWKGVVDDTLTTQAFIYNGDIYINTDNSSVDAPLHEMMHLLIGSIKFTNPSLYTKLVSLAESFDNYPMLIKTFKNRTRSDINEELFVTEFSRYITGQDSVLSNLDEKVLYEISYNVHRLLDSVLMGGKSTILHGDGVYNMSLKQLAEAVNSATMNNTFKGSITDAETHRILSNKKQELFEKGDLKEYC